MGAHGLQGNNRGNVNTLGITAEKILDRAPGGTTTFPRTVALQNVHGSHVAYLGFGDELTVENGWRLLPGESVTLDLMGFDELWAISNNSAELRILVLNAGGGSV